MKAQRRIWGVLLFLITGIPLLAQSSEGMEYRMSSGDQISISVFGEADLGISQRLDDSGKVMMPLLGEVVLTGLTVREAEDFIEKRYIEEDFLVKPEVTVQVTSSRSRVFHVFGEVNSTGMKQFPPNRPRLSVIEAISMAGGLTQFAKSTDVRITRRDEDGKETIIKVNVRDIINGNDRNGSQPSIEILPGDIIVVPERIL